MKKSNWAITAGIASIIALLTIANFTLRAEYKKGHIISSMAAQSLKPFHHIKEIRAKDNEGIWARRITLQQHADSTAILHNYYKNTGVLFSVLHDTLFIEPDPTEKDNGYDLVIYYKELKSLQGANSNIFLSDCRTDSLTIRAENIALISCNRGHFKKLTIEASDDTQVKVYQSDSVYSANILLRNFANFNARNTVFLNKDLKMSDASSVSFSGTSVESFGIKRTLMK